MAGTRVFIGNLNNDARERDVEKFFKGFGKVREIILKSGFGFVEFDNNRDADDACYELNGKDLCGDRVTVELSRPKGSRGGGRGGSGGFRGGFGGGRGGYGGDRGNFRSGGGGGGGRFNAPRSTEFKVTVENLSSRVSWQDLKDYMNKAGEVTYADAHKLRDNEGIVCFASQSDMKKAIEKLDGTELNGRKIKMISESRGKSFSRSHSRSRSRSPPARKSSNRGKRESESTNDSGRRSRSPPSYDKKKSSPDAKDEQRKSRSRSGSARADSPNAEDVSERKKDLFKLTELTERLIFEKGNLEAENAMLRQRMAVTEATNERLKFNVEHLQKELLVIKQQKQQSCLGISSPSSTTNNVGNNGNNAVAGNNNTLHHHNNDVLMPTASSVMNEITTTASQMIKYESSRAAEGYPNTIVSSTMPFDGVSKASSSVLLVAKALESMDSSNFHFATSLEQQQQHLQGISGFLASSLEDPFHQLWQQQPPPQPLQQSLISIQSTTSAAGGGVDNSAALVQQQLQASQQFLAAFPKLETLPPQQQSQAQAGQPQPQDSFASSSTSGKKKRGRPPIRFMSPEDKKYACEVCGQRFAHRHIKEVHMRTHTGEKPFECEFCMKKFSQLSSKNVHVRLHTADTQYQCEFCDERFISKQRKDTHELKHTGNKSFKCDYCDMLFAHSKNKIQHMRIHTAVLGEKPYQCDYPGCDKKFAQFSGKSNHMRHIHTGERPYKCEYAGCDKAFADRSSFVSHIRVHTNGKPYICEICGEGFAKASAKTQHLQLQHQVAGGVASNSQGGSQQPEEVQSTSGASFG